MSLINKMLIDLEERQACLAGERDIALLDISSVNDPMFQRNTNNKRWFYLLGLIALVLSVLLVNTAYQSLSSNEQNKFPGSDADIIQNDTVITAPSSSTTNTRVASELPEISPSLVSQSAISDSGFSLKLDTVIATTSSINTSAEPEVLTEPQQIASAPAHSVRPVVPLELSISDFKLRSYQNRTTFTVALTARPDYAVYALPKPDRVVVEINNIQKKLTLPWVGSSDLVKTVRARYQGRSRALIVLDMFNASSIVDSEVLATTSGYELVITALSDLPVREEPVLNPSDQELDGQLEEYGLVNTTPQVYQKPDESRMVKRTRSAADYYKDGLQLYRSGNSSEAAVLFHDAINIEPGHIEARSMLVSLMMEEGNRYQATELLNSGLAMHSGQYDWAITLAHILVEQGKLDAAVTRLQNQPPKLGDHLEYHAFLAALLQQQGRHNAAEDLYRQLLDRKAKHGVWWMGLGISLQALAKKSDAGYAYRKALRDPSLSSDLRNYIAKQISQL